MAGADDAVTVLEQWIMDVSNLSPELNHLLEEIEAKDKVTQECRNIISSRDTSLQKHVKTHGALAPNAKEEAYVNTVMLNFSKAQIIQAEKCALAEKASILLDRHIKRLDHQIKALEISGAMPPDPLLPSLLNNHNTTARTPGLPSGASTPLNSITGNAAAGTAGPSTTLANSQLARLVTNNTPGAAAVRGSGPGTPTSATSATRAARESSTDAKRRRLNIPAASSNLRQSSAGPGTPKAGTPQPSGRAGSVPRGTMKKDTKSIVKHLAPPKGGQVNPAKRKKKSGSRKKGGVSDADDSAMSAAGDESGSERLSAAGDKGKDGNMDRDADMGGMDEDDDEGGDTNLYCTCRSVSYGNMVACDNDECPYEWFHWGCVGLTKEPAGSWHCSECSVKLGLKK